MTARPDNPVETRFEEQGALPRPGPIGRIVRLLLGLLLLQLLYALLTQGPRGMFDTSVPSHPTFWLSVAIAFYSIPYVVNIGLTRNWRRRPQFVIAALAGVLIVLDLALYGTWWGPPLGVFMFAWLVYWSAHFGLSFLLSGLIATPGCEMRALPHLWTVLTGRATKEHYCPRPIDRLDRWERTRGVTA